jgi:hypothetical protein
MRSVKIDDESFGLLEQAAKAEDRPKVRVMRAAIAQYVAVGDVLSERAGASPPPPSSTRMGPTAVEMGAVCPHPRERRRVLKWGSVCGACGAVVK